MHVLPPSTCCRNMVDSDRDGKINKAQFCNAMSLIRQAQSDGSSSKSLSHSWSTPPSGMGFGKPPSPGAGFNTTSSLGAGFGTTSSLGAGFNTTSSLGAGFGTTPSSGVGFGVSLSTISEGWGMKVQDKRKYVMQFNTMDKMKTGYLAGMCVCVWGGGYHDDVIVTSLLYVAMTQVERSAPF